MVNYDRLTVEEKYSFWNILIWEGLTPEGIHKAMQYLREVEEC